MTTIRDVAELANVSVATVSRVMNSTAPVNAQTREKILNAIAELNYTPNIMAQSIRRKKQKSIAFVVPSLLDEISVNIYHFLRDRAKQEESIVSIFEINGTVNDISLLKKIISENYDAIIMSLETPHDDFLEYLNSLDGVNIILTSFMKDVNFHKNVYIDAYSAIYEITEYIINQNIEKIAYLMHDTGESVENSKYNAFLDALKDHKITFDRKLAIEIENSTKAGYYAAEYLMSLGKNTPNAIICEHDYMAAGVLSYLKRDGFRVPKDVLVSGFGNTSIGKCCNPALTTFSINYDDISEYLLESISSPYKKEAESKQISGQMIIRRSTDASKKKVCCYK